MLPHEPPDAACLARARAGDREAQTSVIQWVYPVVGRTVRANLPRRMAAEDVEQDVLIKVLTSLVDYRAEAPLEHWAAKIAVFTCIDALRKERRLKETRLADLTEAEVRTFRDFAADSTAIGHSIAVALVDRLLETLSAEDQVLLRLIDLQGHTFKEAAALTGRTLVGTKVRVFRARRQLRVIWKRWERSTEDSSIVRGS